MLLNRNEFKGHQNFDLKWFYCIYNKCTIDKILLIKTISSDSWVMKTKERKSLCTSCKIRIRLNMYISYIRKPVPIFLLRLKKKKKKLICLCFVCAEDPQKMPVKTMFKMFTIISLNWQSLTHLVFKYVAPNSDKILAFSFFIMTWVWIKK